MEGLDSQLLARSVINPLRIAPFHLGSLGSHHPNWGLSGLVFLQKSELPVLLIDLVGVNVVGFLASGVEKLTVAIYTK